MAEDFSNIQMRCVVCSNPIPADKDARRASTCSTGCLTIRKKYYRHRKDQRACRYCLKPSTEQERKLYAKWRRFQEASTMLRGLVESVRPGDVTPLTGLSKMPSVKDIARLRRLLSDDTPEPAQAEPVEAEEVEA